MTPEAKARCHRQPAFSGQLVAQDPNDEPGSRLLERIRVERASRAESSGKVKRNGRKSHA